MGSNPRHHAIVEGTLLKEKEPNLGGGGLGGGGDGGGGLGGGGGEHMGMTRPGSSGRSNYKGDLT